MALKKDQATLSVFLAFFSVPGVSETNQLDYSTLSINVSALQLTETKYSPTLFSKPERGFPWL